MTTSALQYLKKTYQAVTQAKSLHMYYVHSHTCAGLCANASHNQLNGYFSVLTKLHKLALAGNRPSLSA